jgi:hypothetical protein
MSVFVDIPRRPGYLVVDYDSVTEAIFTGVLWEFRTLARF